MTATQGEPMGPSRIHGGTVFRSDPARVLSGDHAADPSACVSYLDTVSGVEAIRVYKHRTFELLGAERGGRLLDLGCGPGGRVVGVDCSETMIAEARRRADGLNLPVEFQVGDALRLDFADGLFDGCRADRTLQHLDDPLAALRELCRVTCAGGHIVVADTDGETLIIDSPDQPLTRRLLNFICDSSRNGWMGRQLPGLFRQCALRGITVIPVTLILTEYSLADSLLALRASVDRAQDMDVVTSEETAAWLRELTSASAAGQFFGAVTGLIVAGAKS